MWGLIGLTFKLLAFDLRLASNHDKYIPLFFTAHPLIRKEMNITCCVTVAGNSQSTYKTKQKSFGAKPYVTWYNAYSLGRIMYTWKLKIPPYLRKRSQHFVSSNVLQISQYDI